MKQFDFPSSSSPKIYHTLIQDNGLLSCDCPGWVVKKLNKVRECKHTKKVALDEGLILEERDGQWFVTGTGGGPAPTTSIQSTQAPAKVNAPEIVTPTPGFVTPMLASAMPEGQNADSFKSGDWIMEEKFDGHRIIIRVKRGLDAGPWVQAWSRLGNSRTLPGHIHDLMTEMPEGVYDGELIVPSAQHSYSVTAGQNSGNEALVLFDMLETEGQSIMKATQEQRRAFLEIAMDALDGTAWRLQTSATTISIAQQTAPSMKVVQDIWDRGGEGAILKKLSGKYSPGWRSPDWIKIKAVANATLTIVGFTASKNGPHSIVKLRDDSGIETTVKTLDTAMLRAFAKDPNSYIGKRLVISYQEKMPSGKYRHPMFDHFAGVGE